MATILWFLALPLCAQAQSADSVNLKTFSLPPADTITLDTLAIIPHTLKVWADGQLLDTADYGLIAGTGILFFKTLPRDSITVRYRTLPISLQREYFLKSRAMIQPKILSTTAPSYQVAQASRHDFEPFEGLNKSGSLSRGISVGNNQDAVLTSNLNLQLSGALSDDTRIRASISDNNIPVQPDGTTQNLREFDQVFIEIENDQFGILRAGDYAFGNESSRFMRFNKRVSGAGLITDNKFGKGRLSVEAHGALARGKFNRNQFMGREGDQGPYKLTGQANELFIIIISGSERVYIDGRLLTRGRDNDYIMDYNTGELTFTALTPITRENRIVVEFQYTERNYLRTAFYGGARYEDKNWNAYVNFFNESDNRDRPLLQDLTPREVEALQQAGNNPEEASIPGWQPVPFSPDRVLYRATDSLGIDTVFVFSRDSTQQLYQVAFTFLGQGQGDYVLDNSGINGRVFRFVPRQGGQPQGQYAPIRRPPAPTSLTIVQAGGGYKDEKGRGISIELAGSQNDPNSFSQEAQSENRGTAARLSANWAIEREKWTHRQTLMTEWVDARFTTVERIRNVEFQRDWNLPPLIEANQIMSEIGLSGNRGEKYSYHYSVEALRVEGFTRGLRQNVGTRIKTEKVLLNTRWSLLNADEESVSQTSFLRQISVARYHFGTAPYFVGVRTESERNIRGDSIPNWINYNFLLTEFFTGLGDTANSYAEIFGFRRNDDSSFTSSLSRISLATGGGMRGKWQTKSVGNFQWTARFRNLSRESESTLPDQQTTTGRVQYNHRMFKNAVQVSVFYEAALSNEPGRQIQYIQVPPGTGTHTWIDYNGNGIQELDEFEPARFSDEANYIRTFLLTNTFVPASSNQFAPNLNLQLRNFSALPEWAKKLSVQSYYQRTQKTFLQGGRNTLNPFGFEGPDSLLVNLAENFRSSLFVNRGSPSWNAEYTFQTNAASNILAVGQENTETQEHLINMRALAWEYFSFEWENRLAEKEVSSFTSASRAYRLQQLGTRPSFGYQPRNDLSIQVYSRLQKQENLAETGETLERYTAGLEFQYAPPDKINLAIKGEAIRNNFVGNANSPVGYEMLQGLQPGTNATWELLLQKNITGFVQVQLAYRGRVSENGPVIHNGNVQIKAFF